MAQIDILGVQIDTLKKVEVLEKIEDLLRVKNSKEYIVTPNPEICLKASYDYQYKEILNNALLRVPDGAGLQWAAQFLASKRILKNAKYLNIPIAFLDWLYTAFRFTFSRKYKAKCIPELVHGVDLVTDLSELSSKNGFSIFFLGGEEGIAESAAKNLRKKFPNMKIAGTYAGKPFTYNDAKIIGEINKSKADVVFVAFGAPKQEKWIAKHIHDLKIKLAIGVGGALDFHAGKVSRAPELYKKWGVEWLWRLKKQPWRKNRIRNAVLKFPHRVYLSKVYAFRPYRPNVLCVIVDKKNKFLLLNNSYIYGKNNESSHWQLLQGGRRPYESIKKAAFRESKEEMGSSQLELISVSEKTYSYEWPLKTIRLKRPYKGQKQDIVYLRYTGDYSDVKISPSEHSDFKWVEKAELIQSLHPVRRTVAEIIIEEIEKESILEKS